MSATARAGAEGAPRATSASASATSPALDDVDLDVADGEFVTLLGPSGCGKTTLLRIVAGFERPSEGRVLLGGADVTTDPAAQAPGRTWCSSGRRCSRTSTSPRTWRSGRGSTGCRRPRSTERVDEALALVRLDGFQHRRSHELSGGQMQRVALARAIVNRPQVLLLDEPLSALDLKIRLEMEGELRRLHREIGGTFVYVTHDQREALALSDRVVVLQPGPHRADRHAERRLSTSRRRRSSRDSSVMPTSSRSRWPPSDARRGRGRRWRAPVPRTGRRRRPGRLARAAARGGARAAPSGAGGLRGVVQDLSFRGTGHSYRVAVEGVGGPLKAEVSGIEPFDLGADGRAELGARGLPAPAARVGRGLRWISGSQVPASLVTGGSRGIGAAIARAFLDEGASSRSAPAPTDALERTRAQLGPDRVRAMVADVGDPGDVRRLTRAHVEDAGGIDVVVANATANAAGASEAGVRRVVRRRPDAVRAARDGDPRATASHARSR